MTVNSISTYLVNTDIIFDAVPFVSTATNLIDIFIKCVILPFMSKSSTDKSHYFSHLDRKSLGKCLTFAFPIFGNIFKIFHYGVIRKIDDREFLLAEFKKTPFQYYEKIYSQISTRLSKDATFMLKAIETNDSIIEYADSDLLNDEDFLSKAITINFRAVFGLMDSEVKSIVHSVLDNKVIMLDALKNDTSRVFSLGDKLKEDGEFFLHAMKVVKNPYRIVALFSEKLRNNSEFMLAAITIVGSAIDRASNQLMNDQDFVRKAIKQNIKSFRALHFIEPLRKYLKDSDFIIEVIKTINLGEEFQFIDNSLRSDKNFMRKAAKINPFYSTILNDEDSRDRAGSRWNFYTLTGIPDPNRTPVSRIVDGAKRLSSQILGSLHH